MLNGAFATLDNNADVTGEKMWHFVMPQIAWSLKIALLGDSELHPVARDYLSISAFDQLDYFFQKEVGFDEEVHSSRDMLDVQRRYENLRVIVLNRLRRAGLPEEHVAAYEVIALITHPDYQKMVVNKCRSFTATLSHDVRLEQMRTIKEMCVKYCLEDAVRLLDEVSRYTEDYSQ